jgi:excisionase family DNA binding protein
LSNTNPHTKKLTKPGSTLCQPKPFPQVNEVVTINVKDVHGLVQREVSAVLASLPLYQTECITVQQAAAQLKCFPDTIRSYIRKGLLPAVRLGNDYRIRLADLQKFLQDNLTKAVIRRMHHNQKKVS